jgi:hypothetical protein
MAMHGNKCKVHIGELMLYMLDCGLEGFVVEANTFAPVKIERKLSHRIYLNNVCGKRNH